MSEGQTKTNFAVYLLQAEADDDWVEKRLAQRLQDDQATQPYFFKWESIPGDSRQQTMIDGFSRSKCCAVCVGANGFAGLEQMMQDTAIQRKAQAKSKKSKYNLIPVILPGGHPDSTPELLRDVRSIDFRDEADFDWQFYLLVCGITGKRPGPRPSPVKSDGPGKTGAAPELSREQLQAAFVAIVKTVNAGEKEGLPKEEATALRRTAFENIQKQIIDDYLKQVTQSTEDPVTVQESRTTDAT